MASMMERFDQQRWNGHRKGTLRLRGETLFPDGIPVDEIKIPTQFTEQCFPYGLSELVFRIRHVTEERGFELKRVTFHRDGRGVMSPVRQFLTVHPLMRGELMELSYNGKGILRVNCFDQNGQPLTVEDFRRTRGQRRAVKEEIVLVDEEETAAVPQPQQLPGLPFFDTRLNKPKLKGSLLYVPTAFLPALPESSQLIPFTVDGQLWIKVRFVRNTTSSSFFSAGFGIFAKVNNLKDGQLIRFYRAANGIIARVLD